MNAPEAKVKAEHVCRKAYVYVRQSSMAQVHSHQESTRRQYELHQRAIRLGWIEEKIEIVDEDLGHSASNIGEQRIGFQRLLHAMVNGEVGAIFSVEVSRLARQDSEGYRLVEVAALMGVLLVDEQQVYDPNMGDDRLMLGLKVLLSSNEIRTMRQRMQKNKLSKAQRGELRLELPIGYVNGVKGEVLLDPNEEVRSAVRLIFERYRLGDSLSDIVQYFNRHKLHFPRHKGNWSGPLEWGRLSLQRTRCILSNPIYAGAYVYGRTALKTVWGDCAQIQRKAYPLEPQEWGAILWDTFQGYISRKEYEVNQQRLADNVARCGQDHRRNLRRDGAALLSGLLICGHCGKRMYVHYSGRQGEQVVYQCNSARARFAEPTCQKVPGRRVDLLVAEKLLAALTPAQIELSLAALQELERQQTELAQQWQRRLEGARYAARLAQRRYEQVDPDNRLVARSLEADWETGLKEIQRLESELERLMKQQCTSLNENQRQVLCALAQDLPLLWQAPSTTCKQRKQLVELLIADVTLTRRDDQVCVQIRWHTNQLETCHFVVQTRALATPANVIQSIAELYQTYSDEQIAQILNQQGLLSAQGQAFCPAIVADIRRNHDLLRKHFIQPVTPPEIIQRILELYQSHTDIQIAQILNQEGFSSACRKVFTKSIVADIRRRHKIPKLPK